METKESGCEQRGLLYQQCPPPPPPGLEFGSAVLLWLLEELMAMMIVSLAAPTLWRVGDVCGDGDNDLSCLTTLESFFMSSFLQEYVWRHGGFSAVLGWIQLLCMGSLHFPLENFHWHMEEWVGFVEVEELISGG